MQFGKLDFIREGNVCRVGWINIQATLFFAGSASGRDLKSSLLCFSVFHEYYCYCCNCCDIILRTNLNNFYYLTMVYWKMFLKLIITLLSISGTNQDINMRFDFFVQIGSYFWIWWNNTIALIQISEKCKKPELFKSIS